MKYTHKVGLTTLAFIAALAVPAVLAAQEIAAGVVAPVATVTAAVTAPAPLATPVIVAGPVVNQVGVARISAAPIVANETADLQSGTYSSNRRDVAWMAVGGATLLVGLLIGGDEGMVISIVGGVIGLMGLFRYMN